MSTHDPISDLITRIRNAQMRSKSKVSTPGSKMRENVLEVLKTEGYIRGYATLEHPSGRSEIVGAKMSAADVVGSRAVSLLVSEDLPSYRALRNELSGRPRSNYRKNKLSRIALRELGSKGMIPGLVKSSW